MDNIMNASFPGHDISYKADCEEFKYSYYLADGIYPIFKISLRTNNLAAPLKEKLFARRQEVERQIVERLFRVLLKRFEILNIRGRLWLSRDMRNIILFL